ncbi:MAG: hypothetical protein KDC44_14155, partial [Phaeodactylibacter sp.]|nr:hypothetical protein [Phaeodactylibacter sp.]
YHLHRGLFRELLQKIFKNVALHHIWQDGLILFWGDQAKALVSANYEDNYLEIQAIGDSKWELMQAFRNELREIIGHDELFEEQVSLDGKIFFAKRELIKGEKAEAKKIEATTGDFYADWEELKWCLKESRTQYFNQLPEVQHNIQLHKELPAAPEPPVPDIKAQLQLIKHEAGTADLPETIAKLKALEMSSDRHDTLIIQEKSVDKLEEQYLNNQLEEEAYRTETSKILKKLLLFIDKLEKDD